MSHTDKTTEKGRIARPLTVPKELIFGETIREKLEAFSNIPHSSSIFLSGISILSTALRHAEPRKRIGIPKNLRRPDASDSKAGLETRVSLRASSRTGIIVVIKALDGVERVIF